MSLFGGLYSKSVDFKLYERAMDDELLLIFTSKHDFFPLKQHQGLL